MSSEWMGGGQGGDDKWIFPPPWNLLPGTCGRHGGKPGLGCESPSAPAPFPEPGAAHSLPAASYGQGLGPTLLAKKNRPLPPIPTAVGQTQLHSEQRFLPIFLADEPCAPPCHCCQQTPAAALLHGPRNGLMVKNCSIKNGSKSLKKNSNSLMML